MAKKKKTPKKKTPSKKKVATKKKVILRGKPVTKKKTKAGNKPAPRKRVATREISSGSERSSLGAGAFSAAARPARRGLGDGAAGQSGDLQGLSRREESNDESVEELLEEGQAFEAEAISGVEDALDPDEDEVHTHERPEDEFPLDEDL